MSQKDKPSKTAKCTSCKEKFKTGDSVGCDFCGAWYHSNCVAVSKELFAELQKATRNDYLTWKCPSCSTNASNSAVSNDFANLKLEMSSLLTSFESKISDKLSTMERSIMGKIESNKIEIDEKFVSLSNITKQNSTNISNIEKKLHETQFQLQNMQRINNLNCINIIGIPISPEKNYDYIIIKRIAEFLNVTLHDGAIQFIRRLSNPKANSASNNPPPIMVRFSSRVIAESILDEYFKADHSITLNDITEDKLTSRVFITEHLTSSALKIYRECYRLKKLNIIAKVFTKHGYIFTSESHDKTTQLLKFNSLEEVKKKYPTPQQ